MEKEKIKYAVSCTYMQNGTQHFASHECYATGPITNGVDLKILADHIKDDLGPNESFKSDVVILFWKRFEKPNNGRTYVVNFSDKIYDYEVGSMVSTIRELSGVKSIERV